MLSQWFGDQAMFFSIPALFGTAIFVLRMVFLLVGGDDGGGDLAGGGDVDLGGLEGGVDLDGGELSMQGLDIDSEPLDQGGTNPDASFRIISLQTIAAFLMGAGWGGLGAYRGSSLDFGWSLAIAFGCGLLMLYVFAWLMKAVYDLQTSGNVSPRMVLGREATVDVEIPPSRAGQGTVKIVLNERMRRYRAWTEGPSLPRGTDVKITKINADNTVTVARA
ncbi:MAG: hypothetical protein ACF8Q5_02310 [Phycisphaerales bacterium JB040]